MANKKEKFSLFDWVGLVIGVAVAGFLAFILIWPLIDPTPTKSSSIQENLNQLTDRK